MRGDLSDFAMLMTRYFAYDDYLDVTISDAFAALLMVKRLHLQQEMESKQRLAEETLEQEKMTENKDFRNVTDIDRNSKAMNNLTNPRNPFATTACDVLAVSNGDSTMAGSGFLTTI